MVLGLVLSVALAQGSGCSKDTDCKGERICEAGVCVAPSQPASPPPPPPPAPPSVAPSAPYPRSAYPRVEHRDGLICVQTLADSGQVEESCRREEGTGRAAPLRVPGSGPVEEVNEPPRSRSRSRRAAREQEQEPEEPAARFVLDALVHGGLQVFAAGGASAALPQLSGTLDLGARFRAGVGVVALLNLAAGFASSGGDVLFTAAPGLRLGDRSHFILALGPGFLGFSGRGGSGSGAVFSLITQGVFAVGSVFGFTLQGAAHFDASGVVFVLGAGLGFGAF